MKGSSYQHHYNESDFWAKISKYARIAGSRVLEPALKLFYAARDPDTPTWAKRTMYGALGYFIAPIDAIPDLAPMLGYSDDLGILVAAVAVVASHIKQEHELKAKATLQRWLG